MITLTRIPMCIFAGLGLMLGGCATETADGPTDVTTSAQGIDPEQKGIPQEEVGQEEGMPQQRMMGDPQLGDQQLGDEPLAGAQLGGEPLIPPQGGLIGAQIPQLPMLGGLGGLQLPDRLAVAGVITVAPQEEPQEAMPEEEPVDSTSTPLQTEPIESAEGETDEASQALPYGYPYGYGRRGIYGGRGGYYGGRGGFYGGRVGRFYGQRGFYGHPGRFYGRRGWFYGPRCDAWGRCW